MAVVERTEPDRAHGREHGQAHGPRPTASVMRDAAGSARPTVSVVVPAYNRAAFLPTCLGALFAQTYPRDRYEIVLVDDGSTDATAETARALASGWDGHLRVIAQANGGPASARNAGIRAATGEIVAFTDSDCVADPDWLEQLVRALLANPEAAGVGGPIANAPDPGRMARFLESTHFYRHRVRRGTVDYLLTANVAFRRVALAEVEGFSEREGALGDVAWGEDADLSFRLRQRGYRLALAPGGGITHHGAPASARGFARELYRYGYGSSVRSRAWANGRTPLVELARHAGAALLAPALALRYAPAVGVRRAIGFCPLLALEHGAFVAGLLHAEARALARRAAAWRGDRRRAAGRSFATEATNATATRDVTATRDANANSSRRGLAAREDKREREDETPPLVSVLMPVYNEAAWIERSLGAVLSQDYPADRVEALLIDGGSDDETLRVVGALLGAGRVRVLRNARRLQAAGLNLGLREARGEIIVRVDGHTVIAPDYIRSCVAALAATGAANVGGHMRPVGITATGTAIALATTSRFGVPSAFHTSSVAQETDTVYLGAWPREVLERVGGFDERLRVNEDYELNYRIRRAGGRIYLAPTIRSAYYGRQSFGALARQYARYGAGKAWMLLRRPRSLRARQLVAPAFVAALAWGPVAWAAARAMPSAARRQRWSPNGARRRMGPGRRVGRRALWPAMLAAYLALNLTASARAMRRASDRVAWPIAWSVAWRAPLAFLTLHVSWGAGFWAGLLLGLLRLPKRLARSSRRVGDGSSPAASEGAQVAYDTRRRAT